jgi:hypothetical protein
MSSVIGLSLSAEKIIFSIWANNTDLCFHWPDWRSYSPKMPCGTCFRAQMWDYKDGVMEN